MNSQQHSFKVVLGFIKENISKQSIKSADNYLLGTSETLSNISFWLLETATRGSL